MPPSIVTYTEVGITEAPEFFYVLLRHYLGQQQKKLPSVRKSIVFDEVFHIVRDTMYRVVDRPMYFVQSLSRPPMPVPPWIIVKKVRIPNDYIERAGDVLVYATGPEYATRVFGGTTWFTKGCDYWPVTADWIAYKRTWPGYNSTKRYPAEVPSADDPNDECPVLYYIHGGAYFMGSAHMYRLLLAQLIKSFKGRVFSLDYRLAPQFPFPCPVVDALAGYLYLIRPPPGAKHRAVPPSKIVLGGDSAGGNAIIDLLVLIRDTGLPMPAGAVPISPWVDLTHSMPSLTRNLATDVIPAHGFAFPPSTVWPPPARDSVLNTSLFDEQGHEVSFRDGDGNGILPANGATSADNDDAMSYKSYRHKPLSSLVSRSKDGLGRMRHPFSIYKDGEPSQVSSPIKVQNPPSGASHSFVTSDGHPYMSIGSDGFIRGVIDSVYIESSVQIQPYAMNEQLQTPLASPLFQPSLGGLPPLMISGGASEMLHDEIVLLAHRAANPQKYPVRQGLFNKSYDKARFHYPATPVQLQLLDDGFHVAPLFFILSNARTPRHTMCDFMTSVTNNYSPPPRFHDPPAWWDAFYGQRLRANADPIPMASPKAAAAAELSAGAGAGPSSAPPVVPPAEMVRQRVSFSGHIRALEPEDQIIALQIPPEHWGRIRIEPARSFFNKVHHMSFNYARKEIHIKQKRERYAAKIRALERKHGAFAPEYPSNESPPPSAIIARSDNKESYKYRRLLHKKGLSEKVH